MSKLIKSLPNGQWTMDETLEKSVYNAGMHPQKGYVPKTGRSQGQPYEYDSSKSFDENKAAVKAHHAKHPVKIQGDRHLHALTVDAAQRAGVKV